MDGWREVFDDNDDDVDDDDFVALFLFSQVLGLTGLTVFCAILCGNVCCYDIKIHWILEAKYLYSIVFWNSPRGGSQDPVAFLAWVLAVPFTVLDTHKCSFVSGQISSIHDLVTNNHSITLSYSSGFK